MINIGDNMKGLVNKNTLVVISKLIDNNYHGEAYGFLAHTLGLDEIAAKLKKVCEIHEIAGSLEHKLYEYRAQLITQIHEEAKCNWNWSDIEKCL